MLNNEITELFKKYLTFIDIIYIIVFDMSLIFHLSFFV